MEKKLSRIECREIQMEILDQLKDICNSNNIKYYLAYGSLLGAVRHNGYIPWDDDIDICLFRNDYNKLIDLINQGLYKESNPWLEIIDNKTENYYYTFAKVIDNRTVAKMGDNITQHGIWVDIFPIDNLPDKINERNIFIRYCYFLRSIILSMTTDFSGIKKGKKRYIKRVLNIIANVIGKEKICNHYVRICRYYEKNDSKYVGVLFSPYSVKDCFLKEKMIVTKEYKFEGRCYTGFAEYDYYLSGLYGNYMKLPPEEKQKTHSIHAFWKEA